MRDQVRAAHDLNESTADETSKVLSELASAKKRAELLSAELCNKEQVRQPPGSSAAGQQGLHCPARGRAACLPAALCIREVCTTRS